MPIYTCTTTITLSDEIKANLAAAIIETHCSITGTPTSFAHVVFHELPKTNVFTDFRPSNYLLIEGLNRAGRADTIKKRLVKTISEKSSQITGIPEERIFVANWETRTVFEGGRFLPEPGMEDE
ncbi:tautomerase family protein [Bacillus velezensis]|uniref:tautomerase family protein n=1 Tax=Bacillus velezensis TaxID=492670 RepID=UPI0023DEF996|nr:tautomerase family protein [Bacillus velezensis]MDF3257401.1 tautomerase family protein [Bacillus velezensis]MDF3269747.1 tautomerase family protein [Bacillus velezensis]